ncbi:hypothetical protein [Enhygromyxa salina]|nr:hypothetical protein [Enhygromyxa salina]
MVAGEDDRRRDPCAEIDEPGRRIDELTRRNRRRDAVFAAARP